MLKMIAIHDRRGSFSDHWVEHCKKYNIRYKLVNAFDSDIIQQLSDCDAFMWHHHHKGFKDFLAAKKILFSLEHSDVKVFPDFKTGWHFDDKVAQKYLLEAIGAPLVPSYVFYDKKEAIVWARKTTYPKVFKLKSGAGATNVKLIKTPEKACRIIDKAFLRGFAQFDRVGNLKERANKFMSGKGTILSVLKGVGRLVITTEYDRQLHPEKGYVYFQDFIPNNNFDIRVVVIGGNKAAAVKRFVRAHDFRASGSGEFSYEDIGCNVIELSFDIARKLELQSVAFDFVLDKNANPLVIEMSYCFGTHGVSGAPGYWDKDLVWHEAEFCLQEWILEDLVKGN